MQMEDIKAVIFDLDDTLYPQIEYTRQSLLASAPYIAEISGCGVEIVNENLNIILGWHGIEYKRIYDDLFEAISFDGKPYLQDILKLFRGCKPKISAYQNVYKVLDELNVSYRLGMITDGYEEAQKYKINELNLNDYFEKVLITDTLGIENRKPSSVPYEKLLEIMELAANECVYVGNDPRKDFIACKKLGMKSVRIKQGDYKNLVLDQEYEADYCVDDIINLLDIIN